MCVPSGKISEAETVKLVYAMKAEMSPLSCRKGAEETHGASVLDMSSSSSQRKT
jgi:hypothetical protein